MTTLAAPPMADAPRPVASVRHPVIRGIGDGMGTFLIRDMNPQTTRSAPAEAAGGSALEHVRRLEGHVPAVVTDALHAANAQNADALTRCFHSDAHVDAWGMLFEGFQGITVWIEKWIIENRVQFTDLLHAWDGTELAVHTQVHGDGYNGPATLTFSTGGDTISALRISTA